MVQKCRSTEWLFDCSKRCAMRRGISILMAEHFFRPSHITSICSPSYIQSSFLLSFALVQVATEIACFIFYFHKKVTFRLLLKTFSSYCKIFTYRITLKSNVIISHTISSFNILSW